MSFNIKADTKAVVDSLENRFNAAFARESGRALEQIADGIIAAIKRRKIFPNETRGILKQGLWRDEPVIRKSGQSINLGWSGAGAKFGPGHEWGFKKSKWFVKPVNTRDGRPIKALRFVMGGMVLHSRGHWVSKPEIERPHFVPALKAYPIERRMGEALTIAQQRAGL